MEKNAVGYVRVSREGKDIGIETQKWAIKQYADTEGYNILNWKIDAASESEDCPALKELMQITNPPFDAVIIYRNDRISRDVTLYFKYLDALEMKNIKLLRVKPELADESEIESFYRALLRI